MTQTAPWPTPGNVTDITLHKAAAAPIPPSDVILELADKLSGKVRDAFLNAVSKVQSQIVLNELEKAIESGNPQTVLNVLDIENRFTNALQGVGFPAKTISFTKALREVWSAAANVAIRNVPASVGLPAVFTLTNSASLTFLENAQMTLIREITAKTREAIEQIVTRAFLEGGHPYVQAREIKSIIGLTTRQEMAVANYRAELESGDYVSALVRALRDGRFDKSLRSAIQSSSSLSQEQIDKMVARYKERYIQYRARTIARTETIRASNQGQWALWKQAVADGYLPETVKRKWITARDERVCEFCGPLDGEVRGLDEDFAEGVLVPPYHVTCRCSTVLVASTLRVAKLFKLDYSDGGRHAVDLDGTLAYYDGFKGPTIIGPPIPAMVGRVKGWLAAGEPVTILTARVADDPDGAARLAIEDWTREHIGQVLPVTSEKDPTMLDIWDDRAVQVRENTGIPVGNIPFDKAVVSLISEAEDLLAKGWEEVPRDEHGRWTGVHPAGWGPGKKAAWTKHLDKNPHLKPNAPIPGAVGTAAPATPNPTTPAAAAAPTISVAASLKDQLTHHGTLQDPAIAKAVETLSKLPFDPAVMSRPVGSVKIGDLKGNAIGLYTIETMQITLKPGISEKTVIHEFGHHLDYAWMKPSWESPAMSNQFKIDAAARDNLRAGALAEFQAARAFNKLGPGQPVSMEVHMKTPSAMHAPSAYSLTNNREWMAESFVTYVKNGAILQERQPKTFAAIDAMVRGKLLSKS